MPQLGRLPSQFLFGHHHVHRKLHSQLFFGDGRKPGREPRVGSQNLKQLMPQNQPQETGVVARMGNAVEIAIANPYRPHPSGQDRQSPSLCRRAADTGVDPAGIPTGRTSRRNAPQTSRCLMPRRTHTSIRTARTAYRVRQHCLRVAAAWFRDVPARNVLEEVLRQNAKALRTLV